MTDFEKLTDFQNLYKAYRTSMKGCRKRASASRFDVMALEHLYVMRHQLIAGTYKISEYSEFIVSVPKRRVIKSGSFRDKVLQHCLCDQVLLPRMKDHFIIDNYAGQKEKGTLFGLNRLSESLTACYELFGGNFYILKCDITKFFYSIDHDTMKRCVRKYIHDKKVADICDLFIDSTVNPGLPLGNQCSQVFALMYLDGLDHYITEQLGCEFYGRYMDDFYLLSDNRQYLKDCLSAIKSYLASIHLELNNKTEIVPISKGIRFLGFHTYLASNGVVIRKLAGENKRAIKKRLRRDATLVRTGKMSEKKFYEKYNAWKNHAMHGNCYRLIQSMDEFVHTLLH